MGLRRMNVDTDNVDTYKYRGLDEQSLAADHIGGMSVRALSIKFKRSQYFIKKFLTAKGVAVRLMKTGPVDFCR